MFLFHSIHFLKFWAKYQPQRSYEKGSYKAEKECTRQVLPSTIDLSPSTPKVAVTRQHGRHFGNLCQVQSLKK